MESPDVLVIGAGAIGVCCAYYASRQGLRVTLIDRGGVCSGCSHGNAGLIVPSHCIPMAAPGVLPGAMRWLFSPDGPIYIRPRFDRRLFAWLWYFRQAANKHRLPGSMRTLRELSMASARLFRELSGHPELSFAYEEKGYLRVYKTESGLRKAEEEMEVARSAGVDVRLLEGDAVERLDPNIRVTVRGGLWYPEDAHLKPDWFVRGLAACAERGGVRILPSIEVYDFETSGAKITAVKTSKGEFRADQVVLAAGSWTPEILYHLGGRLLIQGAKGYSFTFRKPQPCPSIPFSLAEAGAAVTPMGDFLRIAGTFAFAGLDMGWNRTRMKSMLDQVTAYLPDLDSRNLEVVEVWRGLRPCSPDGLPYLGRSPLFSNLIVASGHGIVGVTLSPITGKLVVNLLAGQAPELDLSLLRVDRFG